MDHAFLRSTILLVAVAVASGCAPPAGDQDPVGKATSALAIPGLFSTGVDANGTPLAIGTIDPHYVLTSDDPAFPGPNALAVTPAGGWTGNTATSNWISIQANTQGINNGLYTYTTTFTLAGVDPTKATIAGTWAADDSVILTLNGTQVAQDPVPGWTKVVAFTVPAGSPFLLGLNTLAFQTDNSGGAATGLQVVTLSGNDAGCTADAQCTAAQFCNTQTAACTAKLGNSTAIPTIPGHTPALTGACTAAVGLAVCVSGVCDAKNDECGYADGDGPCAPASGPVVCQSGVCSVSLVCEAPGSCDVDADCKAGTWCNETQHLCTPQLANGAPMPTDVPHMSPVLNGQCTAAAGTLVCQSGVCDAANNECGYAVGDGPCTPANGPTLCQSGACSVNDTCEPAGGCNVAGDCGGPTPQCLAHVCVGCLTDADCPTTAAPVCNPMTNVCGPCTSDHAAANPGPLACPTPALPACQPPASPLAGQCTQCSATNATVCAATTATPICVTAQGTCGCVVDTDCAVSNYCNTGAVATGVCTPGCRVVNGKDNCGPASFCSKQDGTVGTCQAEPCATNADCMMAAAPVCNTGVQPHVCVQCLMDPDCPAGKVCDPNSNLCVQCTATDLRNCTPQGAGPLCLVTEVCGCAQDSDCGGLASGRVCNGATQACESGCRGMGGNGCQAGLVCTSQDNTIGQCEMMDGGMSTSSSSTTTSTSSTTTSTSSTGGSAGIGGSRTSATGGHGGAAGAGVGGAAAGSGAGNSGVGGTGGVSSPGTIEGGGCACGIAGDPSGGGRAAGYAAFLAALAMTRRRRRSSSSQESI